MSKHGPRMCRLGVLAPAALSVCMDASVLAVPAAGAIVSTVLKELSKSFMLKKWFHGVMSAQEAESLIMEMGKNGSFLVRESQTHPGEFVLSVRVRGRVTHVMIRCQHNKYDVGSGELFDDLVGLIEHFRSYPMTETSGDVLRLLQPLSGHRLRSYAKQETKQAMDRLSLDCHSSYDGEFQSLKMLEDRHTFTTNEGMKLENTMKNRYRNILPYDQTRVILRCRDAEENDYINANYVLPSRLWDSSSSLQSSNESLNSIKSLFENDANKMSTRPAAKSLSDEALREAKNWFKQDRLKGYIPGHDVHDKIYIAAQGCLSNTTGDFWRMIWQEDIRVIAMITNEIEKGKRKCAQYWPNRGQEDRHAGLLVRALAETLHEQYLVRELDVTNDKGVCRTVYQYQFTAWPDHGAPDDPHGLLAFHAEINQRIASVARSKDPPEQNILCVHCSAGVGRTGTFVVLDMLIDNLKYAGLPCAGVSAMVKYARAQRAGLVQNKTQYRFLYQALSAYLEANTLSKKVYTLDA